MTGPGWFLRRVWWRVPRRHLLEDHLLAIAVGTTTTTTRVSTWTAAARHLRACAQCESRLTALTTRLRAIPEVADAAVEDVFTPQRLQTQRTRIKHRLAQLVGTVKPARVLSFPFSGRPFRQLGARPGRWLAATAAAGVLLGVTAGQLIHFHPGETRIATVGETDDNADRSTAALNRPTGTLDMTGTVELPPPGGDGQSQTAPLTLDEFATLMTEEAFLGNLDLALTSFRVSELESIDALTPRVRDLSINIR